MMITPVDKTNIMQAAAIHAISWQASHRAFCAPDFVEKHTPERQLEYLQSKMKNGSKVYMLVDEKPVGIVSVTGRPALWILENNTCAERLYHRMGFQKTGRRNYIAHGLDEIEMHLTGTFLQVTG